MTWGKHDWGWWLLMALLGVAYVVSGGPIISLTFGRKPR